MGNGGVEESKSAVEPSDARNGGHAASKNGGGGGPTNGDKHGGGESGGVGKDAGARGTEGRGGGGGGLQKMPSFDGVDVLEAGKMALEKSLGAIKTRAAPREGGKLTLGKYLEKARVDA